MQARDLMTTDVETVHEDEEVSEVLQKLATAEFTGFPVVDDAGSLVGVVTQHDFVDLFQPKDHTVWIPIGLPPFLETLNYGIDLSWDELETELDLARHSSRPVSEVMTPDVLTVSPDADIDDVLAILASDDKDVNRVPVVEDGDVVGIISRQDLLQALHRERTER